jgi:serine/threonine protein phosphatase PrpC
VADRYQVWQPPIWLDTQPELPFKLIYKVPAIALPYLRLSDLAQHIPRPYIHLTPELSGLAAPLLLLDAAPIQTWETEDGRLQVQLLPSLLAGWSGGTALQQLNWLRQIALLWPRLHQQNVTSTLLQVNTLRIDGALLRITTLTRDEDYLAPITLTSLGQVWQPLVEAAQPSIQAYLGWLTSALGEGRVATSQELMGELNQAIQTVAQGFAVQVDWVAHTDQGPSRNRNEDACYPQGLLNTTRVSQPQTAEVLPLLLVCDGIGGHEQGNVASQTAVEVLLKQLSGLNMPANSPPEVVGQHLKQALSLVNHTIASRNNKEHRSERARMGTTVVLAVVCFPYVYIAHVGDSRAYRISSKTCYQVTLDDDIASREAQQGFALYPEAAQMPSGGALIQALGIYDTNSLAPSIQYLLLDDPSLLLLCSDGLSDHDRIDALWRPTIQAFTTGRADLSSLSQALIQQANRLNGHDNVTVGLMAIRPETIAQVNLPGQALTSIPPSRPQAQPPVPVASPALPYPVKTGSSWFRSWPLWTGLGTAVFLVEGLWFYHHQRQAMVAPIPWQAGIGRSSPGMRGEPLLQLARERVTPVSLGSLWQLRGSAPGLDADSLHLALAPQRPSPPAAPIIPTGSVVRVNRIQTLADQTRWARLQVCSIPSGVSLGEAPQETNQPVSRGENPVALKPLLTPPGSQGWVRAYVLYQLADLLDSATQTQIGQCLSGL